MNRKQSIIIILLMMILSVSGAQSLGPLSGKNIYLPHLPWYSFAGTQPINEDSTWKVDSQLYWINDIYVWGTPIGGPEALLTDPNPDDYLHLDYESLIWEENISYSRKDWRFTLTGRLYTYIPGIGDDIIEGFHELFQMPNAGREYFPQNRVYIDLWGIGGPNPQLQDSLIALGDTELFFQKSLFNLKGWDISWAAALELPTGINGLTGSSYIDVGAQISGLYTGEKHAFHLQSGLVLPGEILMEKNSGIRLSWQTMAAWEFLWKPHLSLISQMQLNTSPITSPFRLSTAGMVIKKFQTIQTNLRLGLKWKHKRGCMQFYFEEDTFTLEGADIFLNLGYSYEW